MNLHSKICLHTHPYVVVHSKSEKDKYLGTNGVYIRVDSDGDISPAWSTTKMCWAG